MCIAKRTDGRGSSSKLYRVWWAMKCRCYLSTDKRYSSYGGRGITVCDRWINSFQNFYDDMGDRPTPQHSLDRIDNDSPYSPENCRWATATQQQRNKTVSRLLTYKGKSLTTAEWSPLVGIPAKVIYDRVYRGWSDEEALTVPAGVKNFKAKKIVLDGECYAVQQVADRLSTDYYTIWNRVHSGWSAKDIITVPVRGRTE